jgi:MscS family membrane protein
MLHLRRDTKSEQINEMMNAVANILQAHPLVDASGLPLRFTSITKDSFTLEIFAYVLTSDFNEYLKIQTELLLRILETAHELRVGFAVPFQESIAVAPPVSNGEK